MIARSFPSSILLIGVTALLVSLAGCKKSPEPLPPVREYQMRGRVEGIELEKKRVIVAHEDIEGYMKAMTMGFSLPDDQVLQGLKSGDRIEAKLIYDSRTNLSWLEDVRPLGSE